MKMLRWAGGIILADKGKKRPFERLLQSEELQRALIAIGNIDFDACESVFSVLEEFVCRLYNVKKTKKVNEGRYEIFLKTYDVSNAAASFKLSPYNFDASNLPPCQTELTEHFLRTLYITKIWKNAHEKNPVGDLDPNDCGWEEKDGTLTFKWFKGEQLPQFYSDVIFEVEDPEHQSDEEGDMDESADMNDRQGFSDASDDDAF
ncbi:uncharacterized protein LOC133519502 [Cydia pomonella]|uniref:uncharacterized protein LOC133519502 n=1 Tax=Cydia pomonella TaxID=82600 RepID=UPI002ADDFE3F|nr:uncharacterized protein LOC133519502 [Cydia pomonella]